MICFLHSFCQFLTEDQQEEVASHYKDLAKPVITRICDEAKMAHVQQRATSPELRGTSQSPQASDVEMADRQSAPVAAVTVEADTGSDANGEESDDESDVDNLARCESPTVLFPFVLSLLCLPVC